MIHRFKFKIGDIVKTTEDDLTYHGRVISCEYEEVWVGSKRLLVNRYFVSFGSYGVHFSENELKRVKRGKKR